MQPFAILWDVDGTLVDTAELHFEAWVKLAQSINKPFTRDDFARTFGWRNPEIIPLLFGRDLSVDEVDRIGRVKEDFYRAEAEHGVALLPGVRALLDDLQTSGFRQAIGSSAPRSNIDLILRLNGVGSYFQGIVALEDTFRGKPDPEVYLKAANAAGATPGQCLVLEDAPVGIQAAKAAGMKAIGVTFVGHHPPESLRNAGADLVTPTLEAISVSVIRRLLGES